ncbi:MAG: hypothetical protein KDC54_23250 [Lewinella sp.]|nr:hypothetical protein [Lewinella sp.]
MYLRHLLVLLTFAALSTAGRAQTMPLDTAGFQTFSYQDGDTTYIMKQYFMVLLKKGPNRSQQGAEAERIQREHLAHLSALAADRKICMAGPMGEDGSDVLGIVIFNTPTLAEAQRLANDDPAVQAGRLIVEIHPWWAAIGSQLF